MAQLPTFMEGAMRGYGFVDDVMARKAEQTRQAQLDTENRQYRQDQTGLAQAGLKLQQNADARAAEDQARQMKEARLKDNLTKAVYLRQSGQAFTPELDQALKDDGFDPQMLGTEEERQYLDQVSAALNGEISARSPEVLHAFNRVFDTQINKGVGEVGADGNPIVRKEVVDWVPGPVDPATGKRGVMFDMKVYTQGPDGKENAYQAPMTVGRGVNDTEVKNAQVELIIQQLQARRAVSDAFLGNLARSYGAKLPETKPEKLGEGEALVNPTTGKVITERSPKKKDPKIESFFDEKTGREFKGYLDENGNIVRVGGTKAPSDGDGPGGSKMFGKVRLTNGQVVDESDLRSEYNTRYGKYDPMGNFLGLEDGAPTYDIYRNQMVQPQYRRQFSEGADGAGDGMTWEQARSAAAKEADDRAGWMSTDTEDFGPGGREAWINARAKELQGGGKPTGLAGKAAPQGGKAVPQAAIDHLRKNPQLKADFKAKYGYLPEGI